MRPLTCDVLIVGCGPTGVVLANLLGGLGNRVVVLEQAAEVHPIPRATHIDEETQRNFQTTGLMRQLEPFTSPFGAAEVLDHRGRTLFTETIRDRHARHGYAHSCFFHQPDFERVLRSGLARFSHVTLHANAVAERIVDHGERVTVTARIDQAPQTYDAAWVIGCDGGRSLVRKSLGIDMESLATRRPWVIADALLKDPADATRLPTGFRYMLEPDRLALYAHGFGNNRRWEFQLGEHEPEPDDTTVRRWIGRYFDPDRLEFTRIADYAHQSLVARRWRAGRVLLAGDAAHMMPPSAGQGMCSGIRDAVNLAWKLHEVVAGRASPELLDTYERERRPHVCEILRGSLFVSRCLRGDTRLQRWWRRQYLRAMTKFPWLQARARERAMRRPALHGGCLSAASPGNGEHLPQTSERSDDTFGYRFALLARPDSLSVRDVAWAESLGIGVWQLGRNLPDKAGVLRGWLDARRLDFALARPDRIVFAAGDRRHLDFAKQEFAQWLC